MKSAQAMIISAKTGPAYNEDRDEAAQLYVLERSNDVHEQKAAERRLEAVRARRSAQRVKLERRAGEDDARVSRRDPVARLDPIYRKTAELLRDHEESGGVVICRGDIEDLGVRVSRSRSVGGLEAVCDARRLGAEAWARFHAGCGDYAVARQCRLVLLERKSYSRCVVDLGFTKGSRSVDRFKTHLCDGLDQAAAYLGVSG